MPTSPRIELKPNVFAVPTLSAYNECHAKSRFYGKPPFWTFRQTKNGSIWHSACPWTAAPLTWIFISPLLPTLLLKANTEEITKSVFLVGILLPLAKDSTMPSFAPHFVVAVCQLLNGGRADCRQSNFSGGLWSAFDPEGLILISVVNRGSSFYLQHCSYIHQYQAEKATVGTRSYNKLLFMGCL